MTLVLQAPAPCQAQLEYVGWQEVGGSFEKCLKFLLPHPEPGHKGRSLKQRGDCTFQNRETVWLTQVMPDVTGGL